ncbi:uncharacterized protein AKAW2_21190S [Aspergillus luchuensis]|uniref:Actin cortical patch assembly protein Pan1 n=1 Tax=Aspergillus kawachii TaxID=1069201 RepID=A0A146FLA4_ASPKA|nr:uncharacterized protein AKAW2_21190S [Aspergillus luchuensis]BCR96250.1 hypothetical protein AKAW2_21190S [Aspergillus luchuensis]BCS08768.1 hypothetical protein ALUC_21138S [Aspergillus luchuensis]GAT26690.1 actin cortical patch assembly protein Pan1 [Aspergillus luchuensis]
MPHLVHHRRRHSWPYCGPGTQLRERRNLPLVIAEQQRQFEQQFLTPVGSEDLLEDDAASAGIVRSRTARPHRRWYAPWDTTSPSASGQVTDHHAGSGSGSLRKMIRPPLDKARSLFVLPTTTTTGESVLVSYWMPQGAPILPPSGSIAERGRVADVKTGAGYLSVERYHRRCHSEQPRSWKRPSATLWPLEEEQ